MSQEKFKFYINADIVKGSEDGEMRIKGIASTGEKDSQDEYLDPSTFDLSDFSQINWNHKGKDDPSTIIGEPVYTKITANNELYIEGVLYNEVPMAKATYRLMQALQKSPNGNKLGMSVEGRVLERDPMNPSKILKSKITGVAICPVPVNGATWTELITKGYTDDNEPIYDLNEYANTEVEKAISIETTTNALENEGVDRKIETESIDGVTNKKKKKKKKPIINVTELNKAEVYENIFNYFYIDNINKAKQIYNLIEKISKMENEPISQETIQKALEILNVAKESSEESVEKGVKFGDVNTTPTKSAVKIGDVDDRSAVNKADEDKEDDTYNKACSYAKKLMEKGMNEEDVEKAMSEHYSKSIIDKVAKEVKLGANTEANKGEIVKKSEEDNIIKSHLEEISKSIKESLNSTDQKFSAIGDLYKSQSEQLEDLKKSFEGLSNENESLKNRLSDVEKTPTGPKSLISKSFADRFTSENQNDVNIETYNIRDRFQKGQLTDKLFEIAIEKNDSELKDAVSNLEAAGSLSERNLRKLNAMGINVIDN